MSVEALSWAFNVPVKSMSEKVILLGIANHASADGTNAYPSLNTLAEYAGCHRNTVRRALRGLVVSGLVSEDGIGPKGQVCYRLSMHRPGAEGYHPGTGTTTVPVPPECRPCTTVVPEPSLTVHLPASAEPQQVARPRRSKTDQSIPPVDFPDELRGRLDEVLPILREAWDERGGLEPRPRGVGLAMLRDPRCDHVQVARKLAMWLVAGTGQRAKCRDVAARFGDWVAGEGAAPRASNVVAMRPSAGDLIRQLREAEEAG